MKELITFRDVEGYNMNSFKQESPSCFNGMVRVEKYKITVEKIDEPIEVIQDRIISLWKKSNNHHDYYPIKACAERFGVSLEGIERGCDA